jgi:hypothetical protein
MDGSTDHLSVAQLALDALALPASPPAVKLSLHPDAEADMAERPTHRRS